MTRWSVRSVVIERIAGRCSSRILDFQDWHAYGGWEQAVGAWKEEVRGPRQEKGQEGKWCGWTGRHLGGLKSCVFDFSGCEDRNGGR